MMNKFQKRLKTLRKNKGISQRSLSKRFGYGATAVSGYENRRNEPSLDMLIQLAEYFDVTVDYLIGNEDLPKRADCMTKQEKELLYNYRELSVDEKELVYVIAKTLNK